jgi:hypothetical protein
MTVILQPDTLLSRFQDIESRLARLERTNPLDSASISNGQLRVVDANGTTRVEMGNLAANGVSPAQLGIRANDAAGAALFDSLGTFSVMKQIATLGSSAWTKSTLAGAAGPPTGISGLGGEVNISTVNFTLSRTLSVKIEFVCSAGSYLNVGGVSTNIAPIYFRVQGQANSVSSSVHSSGAVGAPDAITCAVALQVPASTFTAISCPSSRWEAEAHESARPNLTSLRPLAPSLGFGWEAGFSFVFRRGACEIRPLA